MTQQLIAAGFLAAALTALGAGKPEKNPLMSSDSVVWAGLDYSKVRMVGPGDFRNPEAIFPAMLQNWNDLFLRERIRKIEGTLKKGVVTDVGGVNERNQTATPKQVVPTAGPDDGVEQSHLTEKDIAEAVRSYKLESKSGLGLVFIVDRLVKPARKGAVYIVFFDVAKREVISADRVVHSAGGAGFRNYWFGVIKKADEDLRQYR